jgi:hypothetical protein
METIAPVKRSAIVADHSATRASMSESQKLELVRQLYAQASVERDVEKLKIIFAEIFNLLEGRYEASPSQPILLPSERH